MLKLVHAIDMNFDSVLDYYNSFEDKWHDLNCYTIRLVNKGYQEYYEYFSKFKKNLYYLVDDINPRYIIGFGTIDNDYRAIHSIYGNIGYGVRPSERNKGYGTILLELLLEKCKEIRLKEVSVSCLEKNIASKRVIEKNGGCFEEKSLLYMNGDNYVLKYLFSLSPEIVYKKPQSEEQPKIRRRSLGDFLNYKNRG